MSRVGAWVLAVASGSIAAAGVSMFGAGHTGWITLGFTMLDMAVFGFVTVSVVTALEHLAPSLRKRLG